MKKIKLLTPILGATAIFGATIPLASCSCKQQDTESVIPSDAFEIKDVTLKGFKDGFDYKNYTKLVIPSNVKVIEENAFKNLFTASTKVTTVVMPSNVETIRKGAFSKNTGITTYDFSSFDVDSIHKLSVEAGAFDLETNNIYSYVQLNDNWTEIQKEALKNKLIGGGVPVWCFVKPTSGNVEVSSTTPKEQNADAGEAVTKFEVKGEYSKNLQYRAFLTKLDASSGVDLDYEPTVTLSEDNKTISVDTKMVGEDEHHFTNDDYVTYKITLVCYTVGGTESEPTYTAKWAETLDTFKLTYHNVLTTFVSYATTEAQYRAGEKFDPSVIKGQATFSNEDTKTLVWGDEGLTTNLLDHTFTYEEIETNKSIKGNAYYTYDGVTKESWFSVSLLESLYGLSVKTPIAEEWQVGKTLDLSALVMSASFAVPGEGLESREVKYGDEGLTVTCDTLDLEKVMKDGFTDEDKGTHTLKVEYANGGITRSATFDIKVVEQKEEEDLPSYFTAAEQSDGTIYVSKNTTNDVPSDLVIKEKYKVSGEWKLVTGISTYGFKDVPLTSIKLPETIVTISDRGLEGTGLTTIDIPASLINIKIASLPYATLTSLGFADLDENHTYFDGFQSTFTPSADKEANIVNWKKLHTGTDIFKTGCSDRIMPITSLKDSDEVPLYYYGVKVKTGSDINHQFSTGLDYVYTYDNSYTLDLTNSGVGWKEGAMMSGTYTFQSLINDGKMSIDTANKSVTFKKELFEPDTYGTVLTKIEFVWTE